MPVFATDVPLARQTTEMVLAHHAIVAALPFVVPTLVITVLVVVMAVRDRRDGDPDDDEDLDAVDAGGTGPSRSAD